MAESDRLRRLQMGESGHDDIRPRLCLVNKGGLQVSQRLIDIVDGIADPQTKIGRDLIVTGTSGMQPARRCADQISQPGFDIHVNVFQG